MRNLRLVIALLFPFLVACSGIEINQQDTAQFAAGNYHYYKWRSTPLVNKNNSRDLFYVIDPVLRREVDAQLQKKGYVPNPQRADFSVDYLFARGWRSGEKSSEASNIIPLPVTVPNRHVDQAVVDNANALGTGVVETNNIALQFNDVAQGKAVWQVLISKIVEDVNRSHSSAMEDAVSKAVKQALSSLPDAH